MPIEGLDLFLLGKGGQLFSMKIWKSFDGSLCTYTSLYSQPLKRTHAALAVILGFQ